MRLERPSPAMVVALLALFVALGGTGYAVATLPKNSVGAKQLKKNAVSGKKIRKNAVTSSKVKNLSLLAEDFQPGQLPAGAKGDQGPPGPTFGATAMGSTTYPLSDPPATTDEDTTFAASVGRRFDFTLPTAGNVYIRMFAPMWLLNCSVGQARAGLYLDGAPVPKTSVRLNHTTDTQQPPVEFVVVRPAGAGAHSVEARFDCPTGTVSGYQLPEVPDWTVLLLGG
jgi:hypothetical protein